MNEPTMHDFDDQLDQGIDALNREASPAPYEQGDRELFSLVDTARMMKSLRNPAEPEPGFAALAVDRIAGDMSRMPVTSNDGIPPASSPAIRPLDSAGTGTPKAPGRLRAWLGEMSELAAVLLVIFVVVGGVALSQTVFSGDDRESPAGGSDVFDPTAGTLGLLSEMSLGNAACCGVHGEVDGESYLFVLTLGGPDHTGHGTLRVLQVDDEGMLQDIGMLETPQVFRPATLTGTSRIAFAGDMLYLPMPGQEAPGLWIVDVSDPESPQEIALVETELPPISVAVSGNLAAVATMSFNGPFLFFDISDPASPQLVSEYEQSLTSLPPSIAFVDSFLYVADHSGVAIIDVTDPNAPQEAGFHANPDWDGPSTSGGGGIRSGLDGVARPGTFMDIAVAGDNLYIAASDGGIRIVNISDPANPQETDRGELPGRAVDVVVSDGWVYVLVVDLAEGNAPFRYSIHAFNTWSDSGVQFVGPIEEVTEIETGLPLSSLILGNDAVFLLDLGTVRVIGYSDNLQSDDESTLDLVPTETPPDEPDSTPLPDDPDIRRGLSFDEAQEITLVELIEPNPIPASLELIGIDVRLASDTNPIDEVYLMYRLVDGEMPDEPIIFEQSNAVGMISHPDAVEKTIGSRTVTTFRTAIDDEGIPLAVYAWTEGGVAGRSYMVSVRLAGDVTEQHLEALIAALPDEGVDALQLTPTPTTAPGQLTSVPIPQNQVPLALDSVEWPTNREGIEALAAAMTAELNGLERQPSDGLVETDRISVHYGSRDEHGHPGLTIIDLTSGEFFPPDWTASDVIGYQIWSGDAVDAGQDNGVVWATENLTVEGVSTFAIRWGLAESTWIYSASAGDERSLELLLAAAIEAAGIGNE